MRKIQLFILIAVGSMVGITPAWSGQHGDELGRCLINQANQSDTKILTQWAFVTIGQTQAAKEIVRIPQSKTNSVTAKAQTVVLRLLAKDCAAPALKATLYEGKSGIPNGIKYAVTQYMVEEMQSQTVEALISKLTNLKTP